VVLPRAAMDFQVGSFYNNHVKEWLGKRVSEVTVYFAHQAPEKVTEYERTFAPATVRFSAPFVGFSFAKALLELPLPTADANLHGPRSALTSRGRGVYGRCTCGGARAHRTGFLPADAKE